MKRLPKMKPDGYCSHRHKDNAEYLHKFKAVFVVVIIVVVVSRVRRL